MTEQETELLRIDREITGKYALEQTERIGLLNRLMEISGEYPTALVADVVVRALEREVWRLAADQSSEYLEALVDALNRLHASYTRKWNETPEDQVSSHVERADRLETGLREDSFDDEDRIQIIFNQIKGLKFAELDSRWDVLHERFSELCYRVQFAIAYGICVNCSSDVRHPMFETAIRLVADAAVNNEDRLLLADALLALRAAQATSLAAANAVDEAQTTANKKFISRFG
jgi:hypothetical protein